MNFKRDLKVKRARTRLTRDKPGGSTLRFEGCVHTVFWSAISVKGMEEMEFSVVIDTLETTEVCENGDIGIKASPPQEGVGTNSPT